MNGLLLVDKPAGWTSFDVVAKVRSILRTATSNQSPVDGLEVQTTEDSRQKTTSRKVKVGHSGTLDPFATGLLVILIGSYCKRAQEFSGLDKTYEVTAVFGKTSSTGDPEGSIKFDSKQLSADSWPKIEQIEAVLQQFVGEIQQIPPAFSAVKVNGQRAYKLARAGKEVKLEPRTVQVYSLQLTAYSYPHLSFTAKVSSGTYIRTLVEDIGKELGVGAYTTQLRRTKVGEFDVGQALAVPDLDMANIKRTTETI